MNYASLGEEFHFSSTLRAEYYDALEKLLFFNKKQPSFLEGIEKSIEQYGVPVIVADSVSLRIRTQLLDEVQNLFVFDGKTEGARLIGSVVYFRPTLSEMRIVHIAVDEDYVFGGKFADRSLTVQMIKKMKEIARKIKGIELLSLEYRADFSIPIREKL